jgi:hypothetical protein
VFRPLSLNSQCSYSSFGIGVDRRHKLKWLFPQERGTSDELEMSTCIPKLLSLPQRTCQSSRFTVVSDLPIKRLMCATRTGQSKFAAEQGNVTASITQGFDLRGARFP